MFEYQYIWLCDVMKTRGRCGIFHGRLLVRRPDCHVKSHSSIILNILVSVERKNDCFDKWPPLQCAI